MFRNTKVLAVVLLAAGALLGYAAATGKLAALLRAQQEPAKERAPARQTTGVPGSPSATTTVDGNYLPNQPPQFGGTINLNAKDSRPWWPPNVVPPKGAPNVLLIMTDDQGYGVCSTFGGVIPTRSS
jgi:hypothetical protein